MRQTTKKKKKTTFLPKTLLFWNIFLIFFSTKWWNHDAGRSDNTSDDSIPTSKATLCSIYSTRQTQQVASCSETFAECHHQHVNEKRVQVSKLKEPEGQLVGGEVGWEVPLLPPQQNKKSSVHVVTPSCAAEVESPPRPLQLEHTPLNNHVRLGGSRLAEK